MKISAHAFRALTLLLVSVSVTGFHGAASGQPDTDIRDGGFRLNLTTDDMWNSALLLGAGSALTVAALYAEDQERARDAVDRFIGDASDVGNAYGSSWGVWGVTLGIGAAGYIGRNNKMKIAAVDMGTSLLLANAVVGALKVTIDRERPDGGRLSFPSGHTGKAFALAPVLDAYFGRKAGTVAYATAVLTAMGRIENDKHYLSDVVAGATIGIIVGRLVVSRRNRSQMSVYGGPSGIGLSIRF